MGLPVRSRVVAGVLCAITISAGVVAFATSSPLAKTTLRLLDGSALVADSTHGGYVHVNGATATPDLKASIASAAGLPMRIVQRGNRSYAEVTQRNGNVVVYPIDTDTLVPRPGKVAGRAHIVSGGGSSFFVDDASGTAQRVDPDSLAALGQKLTFVAPIEAVVSGDGSLLVVEVGEGKAVVVVGNAAGSPTRVGVAGQVHATVVGGNPVVIDRASGEAHVFRHDRLDRTIALGAAGADLAVADVIETDQLVALNRTNGDLISADIDTGVVTRARVAPAELQHVEAPLVTKDAIYLVDASSGSVWVVTANGRIRKAENPAIGKGADNFDAFVNQGYLFVNNPNAQLGAVVYPDGHIRRFKKYDPSIPSVNKPRPPITPPQAPPVTVVLPKPGATGTGKIPSIQTAPVHPQGGLPPKVVNRPGQVGAVRAEAGDRSVALSWGPADSGGSTQLQYLIGCTPDCGPVAAPLQVSGASTGKTIDHLVNGHRYVFTVTAVNEIGTSAPRQSNAATPTGSAVDAPSNVRATANADGTIAVAWDWTSDSAEGLTVERFRVTGTQEIPGTPPSQHSIEVRPDQATTTFDAHLFAYDDDDVADTTFVVTAEVAAGLGPQSDPSPGVDPFETPAAVQGAQPAVASDRRLDLAWTDDAPTGRALTYYVEGGPTVLKTTTAGAQETGLTNGTPYTFSVYAQNSSGERSPKPDTQIIGSPHIAPTISNVSVSSVSFTVATVLFNVDFHGTGPGTCSVNGQSQECDTGGVSIALSNLNDGTGYNFTASATNNQGDPVATAGVPTFSTPFKPKVTVGTGAASSGCTSPGSPCYWFSVHLDHFSPSQTVTFVCHDASGVFTTRGTLRITVRGDGTGDAVPPIDCFYGYGNRQVWVVVTSGRDGTVESNHFTWP
jgi:hypothetical protein